MAAEELIRDRLRGHAPLVAVVGAQIHGGRAPQGTPAPFVQYRRISQNADVMLAGDVSDVTGGRFQIDCYATTYEAAVGIGRLVVAAVQSGNDGDLVAELAAVVDIYEDEVPPKMYRRIVDFLTAERN